MKLTYKNNGYNGYETTILKYPFRVFETRDGYFSFGAPMGKTKKEKEMFDKLVFYNKGLYHGKDIKKIRQDIRNFIKSNL